MNLRIRKNLLSIAVSAGLGALSLPALAAPTVYGDLALAYHSESSGTSALSDNVSLLGVKGDAAVVGSTKYFYDFNFLLDAPTGGAGPVTHLGIIGIDASWGTLSMGRDNGLYNNMVDGATYQQNWFYTPGMSALQVGSAITYKTKAMSGFQAGIQAFDVGNTGSSTMNTAVAGSYATGPLTVGLGYVSYANIGGPSSDVNQFAEATNTYSGLVLSSKAGASVGYKTGPFGAVLAYNTYTPVGGGSSANTVMLTGSYAVNSKTNLAGNYSSTSGAKTGAIFTLIASYAPADNVYYSFEYQSSNSDALASGLTGNTGADSAFALGYTLSF